MLTKRVGSPPLSFVVARIVANYGRDIDDVNSSNRRADLVMCRTTIAWCARQLHYTFPAIGHELGGRHHTTIMHLRDKASDLRKRDKSYRNETDALLAELEKIGSSADD